MPSSQQIKRGSQARDATTENAYVQRLARPGYCRLAHSYLLPHVVATPRVMTRMAIQRIQETRSFKNTMDKTATIT